MNTEKTQTAVEWLAEQLNHCLENNGMIEITPNLLIKLKEQAKAIEKEQIEMAYLSGHSDGFIEGKWEDKPSYDNAEDYYNQTYQTQS